jgi:alkaline phosphatase
VTHATPSALYAHSPQRNWECEAKMPESASKCKDIARQLIEDEPGKSINVILLFKYFVLGDLDQYFAVWKLSVLE